MSTPIVDRETIVAALAFLAAHHERERHTAGLERSRIESEILRAGLRHITRLHTERLYVIGEQIALFGGRNAWPRNELEGTP